MALNNIIASGVPSDGDHLTNKTYVDGLLSGGASGYSGKSGFSGTSGFSGANPGASGYSGVSGYSGFSGVGISGYSGISGFSGDGTSGFSGVSGYSGANPGASGVSGFSGAVGTSGYSGTSGFSGDKGDTGIQGQSGYSGVSGFSGKSGYSGAPALGVIVLSGAGGWYSQTSGCTGPNKQELSSNKINLQTLDFAQSTQSYAEFTVFMPSIYAGGTVTATFVWTANSTSTNSVVWGIAGRAYGDNISIDQAFGTAVEVTDANTSTANQVHISSTSSAMTFAGSPAANQMVQFRIYRKGSGSDNLAATANLLMVVINY